MTTLIDKETSASLINPTFRKHGYIQVYTGSGKGKTTACMGLATRALGRGWKVLIMQFCKGNASGEFNLFKKFFGDTFKYFHVGLPTIPYKQFLTDEERYENVKGWWYVKHNYKEYDLIILDELNIAIELGIIPIDDVVDLLRNKPKKLEIVITGRNAKPEIMGMAQLVTEMKPLKHYWDMGVPAREGIEF
jgi:cob(I)alamin adenosyltransferase